jgi:hypothetical protein
MKRQYKVAYYDKMLTQWRTRMFEDQKSAEAFIEIRASSTFFAQLYKNFQLIIYFEPTQGDI